jgi:hypothetical protein
MTSILEKLLFFPYTFVLMNWAVVAGLYSFARGSTGVWEPVSRKERAPWRW